MGLLTDIIEQHIERKHANEELRNRALRDFHKSQFEKLQNDPEASPEDVKYWGDSYLKLLNPDAKKSAQKGFDLVDKIRQAFGGSPQAQQGQQPTQAPQPASVPQPSPDNQQGDVGPVSQEPQQPFSITDQAKQAQAFKAGPLGQSQGLITPGNINLRNRPVVRNADGTSSTVRTITVGLDGKTVLLPTVINGKVVSNEDAIKHYQQTGEHMGIFDNEQNADQYDRQLHNQMGWNGPPGSEQDVWQKGGAKQQFNQGPQFRNYGQDKIAEQRKSEKEEYGLWLQRGKEVLGPDASKRDLAEYAGSKGQRLPAIGVGGTLKTVKFKLPDGSELNVQQNSRTGAYQDLQGRSLQLPEGAEPVVATRSGFIRSVPHSVGLSDARKQAENGAVFKGPDDKEIDLAKLPEDMGLQAMVQGDKMFWVPITPSQKTVVVGNQVFGVNPYQVQEIGQGTIPALGASKTATSSTGQTPVFNPATQQFEMFTTHRTSTPSSPGPVQAPIAAPAGQQAPVGQAPARPVQAPPAPSGGMGNRIPAGQFNRVAERAVPVREAATQIFGDPSQPDLKGLKDYIHLADDAGSRERLGRALRLTFDGLNKATGGAGISADVGPISASSGGFGTLLQNAFHVPQAVANQQTQIMQQAISGLTPEEREYYNSVMSSFSTIVGLRSLTRASAAQASVAAIERELPVIGVNTFDSKQGADQLLRLAEVVGNGTKLLPKGALDEALVQRINNLPKEMAKYKQGGGPVSAPAPVQPKVGEVKKGYKFKGGNPAKQENWEAVGAK